MAQIHNNLANLFKQAVFILALHNRLVTLTQGEIELI